MSRSYSELIKIDSFVDRFKYLQLGGRVGADTFGFDRYLNQVFYRSAEWKRLRNQIILRDNGCDLAFPGREIFGNVFIHHLNPLSIKDLTDRSEVLFDPDNLVCVSFETHNAIHYGDESLLLTEPVDRTPGDTCPWRNNNG